MDTHGLMRQLNTSRMFQPGTPDATHSSFKGGVTGYATISFSMIKPIRLVTSCKTNRWATGNVFIETPEIRIVMQRMRRTAGLKRV